MSPFSCPRESETIRAAWSGKWLAGCDDDLSQHVRGCAVCGEAVRLAAAFREDREAAIDEARVPSSGLVWWRTQLRARREAARTAERPVVMAQALAVVAGLLAIAVVSWTLLPSVRGFFAGLAASLSAPARLLLPVPSPAAALSSLSGGVFSDLTAAGLLAEPGILFVIAATLMLAPVALYLALARD